MAAQRAVSIAIIGLTVIGCFDPGALMPDSEGRGGAGGAAGTSVPPGGITLVTNGDGWLEANPSGALGSWWSVNDYVGADGTPGGGDCAAAGFPMSACSTLTRPTPGTPFRPDPDGRGMCTSGTSAQVLLGSDGTPAWSVIWGNIIAVNLATPDPSPMAVLGSYDAPAHGVTGFAFDIDAPPVGGHIRVMFATPGTENHAAYWSGAGSDASPISGPGHYAMRWPEINGPFWFNEAPPFDPTKIEWIAFHVVSTTDAPVPFDFCLRNLVLLTD
ncbi:MAG TPA: hypothetical protein VIQ54_04655 [Polyangia bacterium]